MNSPETNARYDFPTQHSIVLDRRVYDDVLSTFSLCYASPIERSSLLADIEHLCSAESNELRLYEKAVDRIFDASDRYDWVGIYKVEGEELVLTAWRGPQPTEHTRIPLNKGICGFVATEGDTVVVGDVNADPRYLGCFVSTKSEIVVPMKRNGEVIAEIDIDSDSPSAFAGDDRETLEAVASRMATRLEELKS